MMERYKGYWITGSAVPGPAYTHYWESFGTVLKDSRLGSLVDGFKTLVPGSTTTCAGSPSFTGWNLAEYSLIIVCPSRNHGSPAKFSLVRHLAGMAWKALHTIFLARFQPRLPGRSGL